MVGCHHKSQSYETVRPAYSAYDLRGVKELREPTHLVAVARVVAALATGAELLTCGNLWFDRSLPSSPPTAPLASWLVLPEPGGHVLLAAMLGALGLLCFGKAQRVASLVLAGAFLVSCAFDQIRFQAPFLVSIEVLVLLASPRMTVQQTLDALRWLIAGVYFFAGLNKLNVLYVNVVHPEMMGFFTQHMPALVRPLFEIPWIVPVTEMGVGLAVVWSRRRAWTLGAALSMHAFILTMLVLAGYDITVLPFNILLVACVFAALFGPQSDASPREIARSSGGKVALVFALVLPLLSMIGVADSNMSHAFWKSFSFTRLHPASYRASEKCFDRGKID